MTIKFGPGTTIAGFQHPGGGGGGGGGLTSPTTVSLDPFGGSGPSWGFNGTTSAATATVAANNLAVTSGTPWCVEGFFYQTDGNPFPRLFSIGSYPSTYIAISIEGSTMYWWMNGGVATTYGKPTPNQWHHFAFASDGMGTAFYVDGAYIGSNASTMPDITGGTLVIGNETPAGGDVTAFGGYMNSFRWTVGNQVYTNEFTVPTAALGWTQAGDGGAINAITSGQVKLIY
jgi:hypothetical protein